MDDRLPILDDGDFSTQQRDVEALPFSRLARHLGRRRQKTVHSAHMMTRRFLDGVSLNLDFVATTQIDAAVGVGPTIEFDVQLEILELGVVDKFGAMSRAD